MDVRHINPFVTATLDAFRTMAGIELVRGSPFVKTSFHSEADVSGIIGLAGDAKGAVVLSFPAGLARDVYAKMVGENVADGDPGIGDAVGELANVVAGGAKAGLSELGLDFQISVPTVVTGKNHKIANRSDAPCLVVPFQAEGETMWLQVSITTR